MKERKRVEVAMESCSICGYEVPTVCPRRYSEIEIVEDGRGFVDYLRCKDRAGCAERCKEIERSRIIEQHLMQ